jgi:hypothetical protein
VFAQVMSRVSEAAQIEGQRFRTREQLQLGRETPRETFSEHGAPA